MNSKTSITVVLDQSGSMHGLMQDTLGGFNKFVADQKEIDGEVFFTLCTFSDTYRLVHDYVSLASVENLTDKTYNPGGNTALLDAIGATIESVKSKIAAMQEADRPAKSVFLIQTDGQENASRKFNISQIKALIKEQEAAGCQFIFLGANIDTFAAGTSMGFAAQNSISYQSTSRGTKSLYSNVSSSIGNYRSNDSIGATMDFMELKNAIENDKDIPSDKDSK